MCGIVGYVGGRPCRDLLIAGLEKLEYRGYDSAGLSLLANGHISGHQVWQAFAVLVPLCALVLAWATRVFRRAVA